jgi:hypothetical protein
MASRTWLPSYGRGCRTFATKCGTSAIARMKAIYQGTCEAAKRISQAAGEHMQRFRKHLRELRDYLVNNQGSLTNYAHAYRNGLRNRASRV